MPDAPASTDVGSAATTASDGAHEGIVRGGTLPLPQLALIALFVTALMAAQVTATKVVAFGLPFELPLAGASLQVPAAVFAYAMTFFASDCYAELYGRRAAQRLVNVAFVMSFVLLALVYVAIALPVFQFSPVGQAPFATALGASLPIVVGSLAAYLVSQNWDVVAFHRLRAYTDGEHLWLRNVGSTATSQAIDTLIFITLAFWLVPTTLSGYQPLALATLPGLIVGQYVVKLAIAFGDTPFVYAVVGYVRRTEGLFTDGA